MNSIFQLGCKSLAKIVSHSNYLAKIDSPPTLFSTHSPLPLPLFYPFSPFFLPALVLITFLFLIFIYKNPPYALGVFQVPGWIESTQKDHETHLPSCPRGHFKAIQPQLSSMSPHPSLQLLTSLNPYLLKPLQPVVPEVLLHPNPPGQLQGHHQLRLSDYTR